MSGPAPYRCSLRVRRSGCCDRSGVLEPARARGWTFDEPRRACLFVLSPAGSIRCDRPHGDIEGSTVLPPLPDLGDDRSHFFGSHRSELLTVGEDRRDAVPTCAAPDAGAGRQRRRRPDRDTRTLHRSGQELHAIQMVTVTVVNDPLARPERSDHLQTFVEQCGVPARVRGLAERGILRLRRDTQTDTEHSATA